MDKLKELYSLETEIIGKDGTSFSVHGSEIMSLLLELYARDYVKGCTSPPVIMTSGFVYKHPQTDKIRLSSRFAGEYKAKSIMLKDERSLVDIDYLDMLFDDETDKRLAVFKEVFKTQCRNDYFYIPLILTKIVHGSVPQEVSNTISRHANGILIRRSKGTVMRIEPQYSQDMNSEIQKAINDGVVNLASEIGLINPTFVELNEVCPQALTNDKNCAFWTMYIFKEIITNIFKKDPSELIEEMIKKPDLPAIIENFKKELVTTIIPIQLKKLGYRWPAFEQAFHKSGKRKSRQTNRRKVRSKTRKNKSAY